MHHPMLNLGDENNYCCQMKKTEDFPEFEVSSYCLRLVLAPPAIK